MKTGTILLALFLLFIFKSYSQDKGYVGISIGPSMPTGDYASADLSNELAGLAKTGAIFDISFGYKLGKNMGLSAMLFSHSNATDSKTIENGLYDLEPLASWTVESKSWSSAGLLFGGYGSFPIGKGSTSFDARAMIGFSSSSSPELRITGTLNNSSVWVETASESASTVAYLIGGGFRFNVAPKVCLLVNLDYLTSKPEFKNVETNTNLGDSSTDTYSQSISTIVGFGIG